MMGMYLLRINTSFGCKNNWAIIQESLNILALLNLKEFLSQSDMNKAIFIQYY